MNKSSLKKLVVLILALLMLLSAFVACKTDTPEVSGSDSTDNGGDVTESKGNGENNETEKSKYDVEDGLGDMDLNGLTVRIAYVNGSDYDNEVAVERLTGDVVSDEVYKRNIAVQKRLNVKLNGVPLGNGNAYGVADDLSEAVLAGQAAGYEVTLAPSYVTCGYVTRGLYHDLNTVENLDLSRVYWSQLLNETYDIGGIQYSASGAISLSFYKFVFVTLVNDTMLKTKANAPDLISAVKNGKWTIEYQTQIIKDYYVDKGVTGRDDEDILGFIGSTGIDYDAYLSSGDVTVLSKGDDGFYSYAFDLARATDVMDDVVALFNSSASYAYSDNNTMEDQALKKFSQGTALTMTSRLIELETANMKNMKDEYTVLPVPRLTEDQEAYYSLISDRFSSVAVPISVSDDILGNVGATIEALAAESYRKVSPAYIETVLRTRYTSGPEKWEIMNMIMENVKMDACLPYTNALGLTGEPRNTLIKLWRYTAWKGYEDGTNPPVSTVFHSGIETKVEENLNGENGLQTYIKQQLAKQ